MKRPILALSVMMLLCSSAFARSQKECSVPYEVSRSFSTKYPNAYVKKWEAKDDDDIAEFKANRRKNYAYFQANGSWVKTETKIDFAHELPRSVKRSWSNTQYASWEIADIKYVTTPDKEMYCIKVVSNYNSDRTGAASGIRYFKLSFAPDGTLIDQEVGKN